SVAASSGLQIGRYVWTRNPHSDCAMKITLNHVSVSEDGDERFHVQFGSEPDSSDSLGSYVIIQRDFEPPDDGRCYLETHDRDFGGRVKFTAAELSRNRFIAKLARKQANELDVTFGASDTDYLALVRVLRIMIPHLKVIGELPRAELKKRVDDLDDFVE